MPHDKPAAQRLRAAMYITRYVADLREILLDAPQGSAAALDRTLEALRCGGDPAQAEAAIAELHQALRAAGDPVGVHGETRDFSVAGAGAARPDDTVYVCPTDSCEFTWWPRPGEGVPRCANGNAELRLERL